MNDLTQFIDQQDQHVVNTLVSKYQNVLKMLVQYSSGSQEVLHAQCESELLQALDLVEQVVIDRLSTNPNEWKNDHKQEYKALFNSIESEAKEAVHTYFSSPTTYRAGFIISKFQQLVVEPMIAITKKAGPDNGKQVISIIVKDAKTVINSIDQSYHQDDAMVARHIISKHIEQRANKSKTQTKQQRINIIARAVEQVQSSE